MVEFVGLSAGRDGVGLGGPLHARTASKGQSRHLSWGKALCAAEAVLGQILSLVAIVYLEGPTAALGLLLGICITVTACLGVSGCVFRDINQLSGHLVGGLLCCALVFGYISQVSSMAHVDCALAELSLLDRQVEEALQRTTGSRTNLLSAVKIRLEAMDSTLGLLHTNSNLLLPASPAAADAQSKGEGSTVNRRDVFKDAADTRARREELQRAHTRELWRVTDAQFVERKLQQLKDHASKVLQQLWEHSAEGGKLKELKEVVGGQLSEGDRQELDARFTALFKSVSEGVRRLSEHLDGRAPLSPQEYERLLADMDRGMAATTAYIREVEHVLGREGTPLTHAEFQKLLHGDDAEEQEPVVRNLQRPQQQRQQAPSARPLQEAMEEAGVLKEALVRQQAAAVAQVQGKRGYEELELRNIAQAKAAWRRQWDAMMAEAAQAAQSGHADSTAFLEEMPRHCVQELHGEELLVRAGLALVAVQAACIYLIWGAAMQRARPYKHECWE